MKHLVVLTLLSRFVLLVKGQTETGPGGFKIEVEGQVYSVTSDICTGGVFFKKPVKPKFICLHGYFLKRANGCMGADNEIIAASQYACIDYPNDKPSVQLLLPVTNSEFPGEHTVAFYDDPNMLSNLRKYTFMLALQGKYAKEEDGARYVVVTNTHNTPEVNIGKVCYDGISEEHGSAFIQDLETSDFAGGAKFGFFKKKCEEGNIKVDFSKAKIFPFTDSLPRYIANEVPAKPLKVPKRPAGMEGLEELLDKTPIMTPNNGDETTRNPVTEQPPPAMKPTITYQHVKKQGLKDAVKWVHPNPQILDPLLESNILAAQLKIQRSTEDELKSGTGAEAPLTGPRVSSPNSYYSYTPLVDVPDTLWYRILGFATEVTKKAFPPTLVDPIFLDAIYNTFGNAFRGIPDEPIAFDAGEFNSLKERLEKCAAGPFSAEGNLTGDHLNLEAAMKDGKIKMDGCPLRFLHFSTQDEDGNDKDERFEDTPSHEYKYHQDYHEPVVETMWDILESALYICSEHLFEDVSDRDRLKAYMTDFIFAHNDVQERWFTNILNPETYQSTLPTSNLVSSMYNLDKARALLRASEDKELDPDQSYWMERPGNVFMPTFSARKAESRGSRNKIHHRARTYSSFQKLKFKARSTVHKRQYRYRRDAEVSNEIEISPDNDSDADYEDKNEVADSVDNEPGNVSPAMPIPGNQVGESVGGSPEPSPPSGAVPTGGRKDYEIWGGIAYCLQMVETITNQELRERGFVPSLDDLKQEGLC